MTNDPHDSIESVKAAQKWCDPQDYGIVFCMWTGTVPAIVRAGEQWRSPNWLTPKERRLRAVGRV